MLSINAFTKVFFESIAATLIFALIAIVSFAALEPVISHAQAATSQFTTKQVITSEISFLTAASNIVMSPSIGGITGGAATGTTQVVVYTNNTSGYTMTIAASGTPSMRGEAAGGFITDYTPAVGTVPDFTFAPNTSGQAAEFGFSVSASNTPDLAQKFLDNGTTCNTGAANTGSASCWTFASTTATSTIVTTAQTSVSGSTSTIIMHTNVPSNPNPTLPKDTYTATTTLTATTNP